MSEKPGKRLVSWKQYFVVLWARGFLYAGSLCLGLVGLSCLIGSLLMLRFYASFDFVAFAIFVFFLGMGIAMLRQAIRTFKFVRQSRDIAPITRHNTGQLPAVETLVRPADLPPSDQQDELLRAAKPVQETPGEELLRASVTRGTDGQDRNRRGIYE